VRHDVACPCIVIRLHIHPGPCEDLQKSQLVARFVTTAAQLRFFASTTRGPWRGNTCYRTGIVRGSQLLRLCQECERHRAEMRLVSDLLSRHSLSAGGTSAPLGESRCRVRHLPPLPNTKPSVAAIPVADHFLCLWSLTSTVDARIQNTAPRQLI
jgi:hypothetical protein